MCLCCTVVEFGVNIMETFGFGDACSSADYSFIVLDCAARGCFGSSGLCYLRAFYMLY